MSEDHIKTVVIDLPMEQYANEEARDETRPDDPDNFEKAEYKPALPSSWLT